jgi:hypothetical protein
MVVKPGTGMLATAQMQGPHGQVFVRGVESRGPHGQVFVRGVELRPSPS